MLQCIEKDRECGNFALQLAPNRYSLDQAGEEEEVLFDAAADVKDVNGQGLNLLRWADSDGFSGGSCQLSHILTMRHWQDIENDIAQV